MRQQSLEPLKKEFQKNCGVLMNKINNEGTETNDNLTASGQMQRDDNFGEDEEEILTFIAALEMLNIEVPEGFNDISNREYKQIFKENKISIDYGHVRDEDDNLEEGNNLRLWNKFFSFTLNEKLMEICDLLTLQDIFK